MPASKKSIEWVVLERNIRAAGIIDVSTVADCVVGIIRRQLRPQPVDVRVGHGIAVERAVFGQKLPGNSESIRIDLKIASRWCLPKRCAPLGGRSQKEEVLG